MEWALIVRRRCTSWVNPVWLQLNQYSIFIPSFHRHFSFSILTQNYFSFIFSPFRLSLLPGLEFIFISLSSFYTTFHQSLIITIPMRKNKKQRQKKNIFDEEDEEETNPHNNQNQPDSQIKAEWISDAYDAAKYQENDMYIHKAEKQNEHALAQSKTKEEETGKSKKKKIPKKKKLFDSEESEGDKADGKDQTQELKEDSEQEQKKVKRRDSGQNKQQPAIFQEKQDLDENLQDSVGQEPEKTTGKAIQDKSKFFDDQPMSFAELLEQAGNDRQKIKRLLKEPLPKGCKLTSTFKRLSNGFSQTYQLLLEDERAILFCQNQRGSIGANFYISMTKEMDKKSVGYVGKLRGNAAGSAYLIYDAGEQPGKNVNRKNWRATLGKVQYQTNFLGMNGPRKLNATIPSAETLEDFDGFKFADNEDISDFNPPLVTKFRNKQPKWNERLKSYALNFGGRVKEASIKNFILVNNEATEQQQFSAENILVFGKSDENSFSLQAIWPLSVYQAFCIVISEFDFKLNCQ